jgi:hypothetical protein
VVCLFEKSSRGPRRKLFGKEEEKKKKKKKKNNRQTSFQRGEGE